MKKMVAQDVNFSVISARKIPFLLRMISTTQGGDMTKMREKNYAKHLTHFVALSGISKIIFKNNVKVQQ